MNGMVQHGANRHRAPTTNEFRTEIKQWSKLVTSVMCITPSKSQTLNM